MTRHPLSCRGCGGVTSISVNSYAYYSGDCVPVTRGRFTISTGIYRSLRTRSESWLFLDVHKPACNRGNATQAQISRTCGLPLVTVKRFVKLTAKVAYVAFFALQKRRAGRKLTAEVWQQAQMLLNKGLEVPEVGRRAGILANTLRKAIRDGD